MIHFPLSELQFFKSDLKKKKIFSKKKRLRQLPLSICFVQSSNLVMFLSVATVASCITFVTNTILSVAREM